MRGHYEWLARAGAHTNGNRPSVVEEISLNQNIVDCYNNTGFEIECVVVEWLVKPRQLTKETVDLKEATKSSPILILPVARVHFISKDVTGVICQVPVYYYSGNNYRSHIPCYVR